MICTCAIYCKKRKWKRKCLLCRCATFSIQSLVEMCSIRTVTTYGNHVQQRTVQNVIETLIRKIKKTLQFHNSFIKICLLLAPNVKSKFLGCMIWTCAIYCKTRKRKVKCLVCLFANFHIDCLVQMRSIGTNASHTIQQPCISDMKKHEETIQYQSNFKKSAHALIQMSS